MSHTPGPWRWWPFKESSRDYLQIASGKKHVAQVRNITVTDDDLRLVVAAPDLLEALECVLEMIEMNGFGKAYAMDIAKAAIAKARGQG